MRGRPTDRKMGRPLGSVVYVTDLFSAWWDDTPAMELFEWLIERNLPDEWILFTSRNLPQDVRKQLKSYYESENDF